MSSLFVSNLDYSVSEDELEDLFSKVGEVASVKIIKDRNTGESKGFGFIVMGTEGESEAAIESLHGEEHKGRKMVVDKAKKKEPEHRGPRNFSR